MKEKPKHDSETVKWLGKIMGKSEMLHVQHVGSGKYGILEVQECVGGDVTRTLRVMGFKSASEAQAYSEFMHAQILQEQVRTGSNEHQQGRAREIAIQQIREHVMEHIRFLPVCLMPAITDTKLEQITGLTHEGREPEN